MKALLLLFLLSGCASYRNNLTFNDEGYFVYKDTYGKTGISDELPSLVNNEDSFNYVRHNSPSSYNFTYQESPYNTVVYPKHKNISNKTEKDIQ